MASRPKDSCRNGVLPRRRDPRRRGPAFKTCVPMERAEGKPARCRRSKPVLPGSLRPVPRELLRSLVYLLSQHAELGNGERSGEKRHSRIRPPRCRRTVACPGSIGPPSCPWSLCGGGAPIVHLPGTDLASIRCAPRSLADRTTDSASFVGAGIGIGHSVVAVVARAGYPSRCGIKNPPPILPGRPGSPRTRYCGRRRRRRAEAPPTHHARSATSANAAGMPPDGRPRSLSIPRTLGRSGGV